MANIKTTLLSLDGVMGEPHVWARAYFDDNARRHSLEQLEHYTRDCAWFIDQDGRLGQLRPGYHADLAVLSGDHFSVPNHSIKDLKSVMAIVGSKVVFSDGTFHSERRSPWRAPTATARTTAAEPSEGRCGASHTAPREHLRVLRRP
jgi:cytosine/adenosine deaminase-related metal-dependent hydrolase